MDAQNFFEKQQEKLKQTPKKKSLIRKIISKIANLFVKCPEIDELDFRMWK